MEEYHQITITEYLTWKQEIKDRLNTTVDNFIVIGYRLKQIRDSEAYRNDGYPSMGAFVQAEYGLNEATASKFMKINDNYSEGGNSMLLQERFRGYGYNKLYEMIALPEPDRNLITVDTSVKEIREIKQFNKESEQKPAVDADEEKLLKQLLTDNQEAFQWIMSGQEKEHMEDILYALAPSGSRMIRQGTLMLFLQSEQEGVKIKKFGAGQQQMSYVEFFERIRELFAWRESKILTKSEETGMLADEEKQENFDIENTMESEENETAVEPELKAAENVLKQSQSEQKPEKTEQKKPENTQKIVEKTQKPDEKKRRKNIIDIGKIKDSEDLKNVRNENTEESERTERESTPLEPVEVVDNVMTRWDYLKTLSAIDAADYIQSYLDPEIIEDIRSLENWLLAWVDEHGKN